MTTLTLSSTAPPVTDSAIDAPAARLSPAQTAARADALLGVLPAALQVLQLGFDDGTLAHAYRSRHPGCRWHSAPESTASVPGGFDLIVLLDGWMQECDPQALLRGLHERCALEGQLFVDMENQAQYTMLQRWIEADLTDAVDGPLAQPHLRHASAASLYKLLLDTCWSPTLAGTRAASAVSPAFAAAALALAESVGVPVATARRQLETAHLIVQAHRSFSPPVGPAEPARFAVVVPTTRENQLRLNVEHSPGLREVDARIVSYRQALNPAEALEQSLAHLDADWVLLCHQDVYFPQGFGQQLNALLAGIAPEEATRTLIGFAGMGVNRQTLGCEPAGFVIDRQHRFDQPASDAAVSIDELAIVVSRHSVHRIDPAMGWHLWATELCLGAICTHKVFPRIVRLPLFHNSLNDYQLPESYYDAAERLLAKYPSFGPISTLCGKLDAEFLARRPAPANTAAPPAERLENGRFLLVDAVDAVVGERLAQGDAQGALARIVAGVHQTYLKPEFSHHALFYPQLDRRLEQLAAKLAAEKPAPSALGRGHGTMLIATELYELGGHSRVLEDVSKEVTHPVIVLTDLFHTYDRSPAQADALLRRFPQAAVLVLPPGSYWEKCALLRQAAIAINPRDILYFGHHQDPIPYVGTLALPAPAKHLFHHADHNASLGCTIPSLAHIDFSETLREVCAHRLERPVGWLPMFVPDAGRKVFAPVEGQRFSVVTSGHPAKFRRSGEQALQEIVATVLETITGCFFHIGPLDAEWVTAIRRALAARGLDPQRFVHLGQVPSVWETLKHLDAHCYLGSAPVGGGRAAIEAEGCGYPLVFYKGHDAGSLLANFTLYANQELGWVTLAELRERLLAVGADHARLSDCSRELYDSTCSHAVFRRELAAMLAC
ncbi:MAG: hypothetical protein H7337_13885 [Rhizobacter sp.]|nr:hypothetical protein [Rhizobacter sp.]